MSKGPGRIDQRIAELFAATRDRALSIDEITDNASCDWPKIRANFRSPSKGPLPAANQRVWHGMAWRGEVSDRGNFNSNPLQRRISHETERY